MDGSDDPQPRPGSVEVGFEANLGCWIFQGLPPGPAGLMGTDLPGGVRLVVDVAQPERLVACEVRAGARARPDAGSLRLVEAILGPVASRILVEGRARHFWIAPGPLSPGVRKDLLRLSLALALRAQRKRSASVWWSADVALLVVGKEESLGLFPLALGGAVAAGRAYAELDEEHLYGLNSDLLSRLAALCPVLRRLVRSQALRHGIIETYHRVTAAGSGRASHPIKTESGPFLSPGAAGPDADVAVVPCPSGEELACAVPFKVGTQWAASTMDRRREACSIGAAAAAAGRVGAHLRSAAQWEDCARAWSALGDVDRESLAWRLGAREYCAAGLAEAAALAAANTSTLSTTWSGKVVVAGATEPFLAELLTWPTAARRR